MNPLKPVPVTVIIPVYNRAELCVAALQSVYDQTVQPAQVILVDDGSTESFEGVQEYLTARGGLYLRQQHGGVAAARNLGVAHAASEWVAFLDSDDLWLPEKLELQYMLHLDDPALVISQTLEKWLRNGKEVSQKSWQAAASGECFERSLSLCCISASAVMIKRSIFLVSGGFDTDFPVCEDYDLWLRLTALYPVGLVDRALVIKNRGRSDQLSEAVAAPDRYRLRALVKMANQPCSLSQQVLIKHAIADRISILEKGAIKRGLKDDLIYYEQLRQQYLKEDSRALKNVT